MSETNLGSKGDKYNADKSGEEKRKRRTRNDQDGRNFSCNCGKSYLSYPALYTHIKTKHNGKPEFSKVAIPREDIDSVDVKDQEDIESIEKAQDANNLQILKKFLTKFFPYTPKDDKKLKELTKDEVAYIKGIKDYWEKRKKEDEPHQNEAYSTSIDNVFGKFLIEMENDVSKSCQKYLYDFIINMRNGVNQLKSSDEFCKSNNASNLPMIMNDIFMEKFQKMEEGHLYIRHPTIICKTIYHFSRWLFQERFTNLSLKFNTF